MSQKYDFKDGPFLFNDGEFHFWTVLEVSRADPLKAIRYLGTVRIRADKSPLSVVEKRHAGKMYMICVPYKSRIYRWRLKYPHKTLYKAPYPLNRALCRHCLDVVESRYRHEFKRCKCGKMAVDGGYDYCKRVGDPRAIEEMP